MIETESSGMQSHDREPLTFQEKSLYHQIHPVKLATDWGTGILALDLFWEHRLGWASVVALVPSVVVSFLIVRYAHLEHYKQSRFGRYIRRSMTRTVELVRFVGYAITATGAWVHALWMILLGLVVILLAWGRGLIFR